MKQVQFVNDQKTEGIVREFNLDLEEPLHQLFTCVSTGCKKELFSSRLMHFKLEL